MSEGILKHGHSHKSFITTDFFYNFVLQQKCSVGLIRAHHCQGVMGSKCIDLKNPKVSCSTEVSS